MNTDSKSEYPSVFADPAAQAKYELALAEVAPSLQKIIDEIEASTRLTAADYAVTINAR